MRIRRLMAVAMAAAIVLASTAVGAPDKTVTLSAATPEFNWDGEQGQYTNTEYSEETCSKDPDTYCEFILLDIRSDTPVVLDASLTEFSNPLADFDLRIYKSNAAGDFTADDQLPSNSFTDDPTQPHWGGFNGQDEFYHVEGVPAGFYLIVVSHYLNPNATYKGNVKVTGATGGAATPPAGGGSTPPPSGGDPTPPPSGGGGSTPPPAQAAGPLPFQVPGTIGSARKAKKKRSISFKASATEAISNLRLSLVDKKKKVVAKTALASFPKGSKTIKLKVKRLKAGRYNLISSGTVNGENRVQTQAVRIKR